MPRSTDVMVPRLSGATVDETPSIRKMLKMLEPRTLPIAMSVSPFRAAITEVTSSGNDVPAATMVRATMDCETPSSKAMPEAPSTSHSPPKMRHARPTRNRRMAFHIAIGAVTASGSDFFLDECAIRNVYAMKTRKQPRRMMPSRRLMSSP